MKVTLVAYTPNPDGVCAMAARTCISQSCPTLDGRIDNLRHALSGGHESVAEHAVFTFQVEGISRACSHQLVRHRLASYSQQSQRYVNMNSFKYVTPKSISECEKKIYTTMGDADWFAPTTVWEWAMDEMSSLYNQMVEAGIPEEDARYILPNACCTNITVSMNARELRHMAGERMCARAQNEIRELVTKMVELASEVAPILFEGVGPKCERLGKCPEIKSCGHISTHQDRDGRPFRHCDAAYCEKEHSEVTEHMPDCPEWEVEE